MKWLIFACILCAGCNHSPASSTPVTTTASIPSATASTPASADPAPSATATVASNGDPCAHASAWAVDRALDQKGGDIQILAWRQKSDDRPLYVDEALVWQHGEAGWTLAQVYRHPKEDNAFHLSIVCDAPYQPEKSYDHAPKVKDVKDFLKNTTWADGLVGFKLDAGKACTDNWSRVIGAPPPANVLE